MSIITPPFNRNYKLDFETLPKNEEEFHHLVNNAPYDILKGFGFRKWMKWNDLVKENQEAEPAKIIEIPFINADETLKVSVGREESHASQLGDTNEYIILFPGEWFDLIPIGYTVYGLHGEPRIWDKKSFYNETRFGCLAYGFRKILEKEEIIPIHINTGNEKIATPELYRQLYKLLNDD